ncbi:helix-turn-helix domain-containing protein [Thiohalocapsa sp. ML1]|jgi:transcriptional regulator with XRE-family HTH domain|uniref:helix-turn-helix domain-containing protein n=1 Tax=Thiohalocapsa sp. ML1 TaxID=1431688 RepID=UPI00073243D1|nr:helix-turn-helix transcriptional regulator [Thiohalocapsa sp. ML1]
MKEAEQQLNHEIGQRLRTARMARGLSLNELSALTNKLYSKSRISNYEQGIRRLSVEGAQALAEALGNVSAAYLLCLDRESGLALNEQELRLLEAFRRTDDDGRRRVLDCADIVISVPAEPSDD